MEVIGTAATVAQLTELVDRRPPDVVLLDYELPDGNGADATRSLKGTHPGTGVVILTAYANEAVLLAAIEAGCTGFVAKHEGAAVVANAVRLAAAGEVIVSAAMLQLVLSHLRTTNPTVTSDLTSREIEVLEMLAEGIPSQLIAERLFMSTNTVRNHAQRILTKLGAHSRLEAVAMALREGIIRRK